MARQDELSKLQTKHQLILDAAGEGVYGLDRDGNVTFSNAAATEIDIVHVNAEYPHNARSSDHEPVLVRWRSGKRPK